VPKFPRWPGTEIIKIFNNAGWRLDRIEGSHHILVKDWIETILSVPVHGTKTIKVGLLNGLINDAGLTNDEFLNLCYKKR
jgi:predicted RNA binding protein YcfA (HicA-like mRNA interferase family)